MKGKIFVDKEGRWYYEGKEIIREDIIQEFLNALQYDEEGRYWICFGEEKELIEVEDTVFLVRQVEKTEDGFIITLNDGTKEEMDLETFWIDPRGVPYCLVKNKKFPARLEKIAFYQLAQHAYFDGENYVIEVGGKKHILNRS
jgi:hypothetical protein